METNTAEVISVRTPGVRCAGSVILEISVKPEEAHYFLNDLRAARLAALADAENAAALLTAFERFGFHLVRPEKPTGLGAYRAELLRIAGRSEMKDALESDALSSSIPDLFDSVLHGRNEEMHVGVSARRLVDHAVRFALLLEKGLMAELRLVKHYMVPNPVVAELWQTVAHVRQTLLIHQFSHLPCLVAGKWQLISDHAVAGFLHRNPKRGEAMAKTLDEVLPPKLLVTEEARIIGPTKPIEEVLKDAATTPWLVVEDRTQELRGIITAFDLL